MLLWSLTLPLVRAMRGEVSIEALPTLRLGVAAIVPLLWWAFKGTVLPRGLDFFYYRRQRLLLCHGISAPVGHGIRTVSSGPASVLVDTMPDISTVLSVFLLNHRANWRTCTGLGIAFLGAAIIAFGEANGHVQLNRGVGLLLLAALIFGIDTVAQMPVMQRYDSLGVVAVSFAVGALAMLFISPNLMSTAQQIPSKHLLTIAVLAVGPGALAYALWGHALSKLSVSKASASLLLIARSPSSSPGSSSAKS